MKMKIVAGVVLVAFAIGLAGVALAQPQRRAREKIQQRVEMMLMWKLTNALDLDSETAAKLFPLMNKQKKERQVFEKKAKNLFTDMKEALEEDTADADELTRYIEEMIKVKADMDEMASRHLTELRDVLTVEQQARLLLLLPQLQKGLQSIVAQARRGFGKRGHRQGWGRQGSGGGWMPQGGPEYMPEGEGPNWRSQGWEGPDFGSGWMPQE